MLGTVLFLSPKGSTLEIIKSVANLGYKVCVIENDLSLIDNSVEPYKNSIEYISERFLVKDWNLDTALLQWLNDKNKEASVVGVYPALEPTLELSSKISTTYGLKANDTATNELILNKYKLRKKLLDLGLSKLKAYCSKELKGFCEWPFSGPAYFKPIYGFGSAYVKRCESFEDLNIAISDWNSRRGKDPSWVSSYLDREEGYYVEEAFDGELMSVEGISEDGGYFEIGQLSRILYSKNHVVEMGSCFPYSHKYKDSVSCFSKQLHKALGYLNGLSHVEVMVNESGAVELIDFNPRLVGADVLQSINFAYDIKIQDIIASYLVKRGVKFTLPRNPKFACLQYVLTPAINKFEKIAFPDSPEVVFSATFKEFGEPVSQRNAQFDYLGCYLVLGSTFDQALSRSWNLRNQVVVNGKFRGEF